MSIRSALRVLPFVACFAVSLAAGTQASAEPAPIAPTTEAWYQTCSTACPDPTTLPGGPPVEPGIIYPPGTLRVAAEGGAETARTYLKFDLPQDPREIVSADLDIVLDTASQDGSAFPETAKINVCSFSGPLTAERGSLNVPPTTSCVHAAPVTFVAGTQPRLRARLTGLTSALGSGGGLALLPDTSTATTDTWSVVFSAHDRTPPVTAPAQLTVTRSSSPAPTVSPVAPVASPTDDSGTASVPPITALDPVAVPLVPGAGPLVGPPPSIQGSGPVLVEQRPQPVAERLPYAYPARWLLPLGFLILLPLIGRLLSADLSGASGSQRGRVAVPAQRPEAGEGEDVPAE